jgi:hypothetical protein
MRLQRMGRVRDRTRSLLPCLWRADRPTEMEIGGLAGSAGGVAGASPRGDGREEAARSSLRSGLAQAEEKYLAEPGATLGTWFARVHETIAVASRVSLERFEEARSLTEDDVAAEQVGLQADICAEAIRAAAQAWGVPPTHAREEILGLVLSRHPTHPEFRWIALLESLVRCNAALESLANGLREVDLPMGPPTDCHAVAESFVEVAGHSYGALYALC